jgi:hypothetical protein
MGTDAEIFIFDHEAYLTMVVPAFVEILREARIVDWLYPFVERRELDPSLWGRSDLARLATCLNPDLSWVGPYNLEYTYDDRWRQRWSYAGGDSEDAPSDDTVEQVNWLFDRAVSLKCLGPEQFVGRSMTVSHYSDLLPELGVKQDDPINQLLAALGKRGFMISYQFGFGFEGVNGWLDSLETAELARRLDSLRLPRYEVSFAGMQQFFRPDTRTYECPGFSFAELILSFVRTAATIAAADGRGILWGNGL